MGARQPRILNVNDHEQTRYVSTRVLTLAGYEVEEAATGDAALRRILAGGIDIVVLDIKLPDISGLEVCRMIKARPSTASTLVLQTSATYVTPARKVAGLESGADAYMAHPFEAEELIATVKALLRLKEAEEGLRHRAEALLDADHRKDEFLAMLAHELRNPLNAITTALPVMRASRDDSVRFDRLHGVIERQARHLSRLIADLLDVARVTRGLIELRRAPCDAAAVLAECIEGHGPTLQGRHQEMVAVLPPGPVIVDADVTRLQQIFSNLIDNASKYSPDGAKVRVALTASDGALRFVVSDDGIGMEQDVLEHLFDLFFQADSSLERTRGGLGIGLTMVKRLIDLHGFRIDVHSDGAMKGSELTVTLPLLSLPAASERHPLAPVSAPGKAPGRSILIIEDNQDCRESLQELLEDAGHKVETAENGLLGVDAALRGKYDIAFVDIGLPGLNGFEVAREIRARGPERLRLVALTGYGGSERQRQAIGAGFDRHLVKPIDEKRLWQVLDENNDLWLEDRGSARDAG